MSLQHRTVSRVSSKIHAKDTRETAKIHAKAQRYTRETAKIHSSLVPPIFTCATRTAVYLRPEDTPVHLISEPFLYLQKVLNTSTLTWGGPSQSSSLLRDKRGTLVTSSIRRTNRPTLWPQISSTAPHTSAPTWVGVYHATHSSTSIGAVVPRCCDQAVKQEYHRVSSIMC